MAPLAIAMTLGTGLERVGISSEGAVWSEKGDLYSVNFAWF